MKKALIIIDVQNDYFDNGGMALVGMDYAAKNCQLLLEFFRATQLPIFHIQHFSAQIGATFFIPNTKGCDIHDCVKPRENEGLMTKHYPNAFRNTGLNESLQKAQVTELVVCGAMTHMCIDTTVRAAFDFGYSCKLISDACATRDLEFEGALINASEVHAAFMAALKGTFAKVLSTQYFLNGYG
ncbi:MAG: cysteine hydrolase family protein [Methylovulum sp.]|nr:cysteine hydrolase family protein [Methylovulum sp.]